MTIDIFPRLDEPRLRHATEVAALRWFFPREGRSHSLDPDTK
jgi:hypothetical protein